MVAFDSQLAFERAHIRYKRMPSPSLHPSGEFCFLFDPPKGTVVLISTHPPKKMD